MQNFLVVSTIFSWITIIFILFLTLAIIRRLRTLSSFEPTHGYIHTVPPEMLQIGEVAPTFIAETMDGSTVSNIDYENNVTVFTFVSYGCSPCVELINHFNTMYDHIDLSGLVFVLVSVNPHEQVQSLLEQTNTKFQIIVAPKESNSFGKDYKVRGTPSTYVIDYDGKVKWSGYVPESEVENLIAEWTSYIE